MDFNIPIIITASGAITMVIESKTYAIDPSDKNYNEIREAIKLKDLELLKDLVAQADKLKSYVKGDVEIKDGLIYYKNNVVDNVLVDKIIAMRSEGFDIDPMLAFLNNLMLNPSRTAVQELYLFLQGSNLPITPDGHFLAYKRVDENYKDYHTGTMDNSLGKILEVLRNQVDDNRDRTCSYGLHFCSLNYLKSFNSGQGHIMILKINPKDVVSIPSDYENTKGRTCRYEIIGEHELDEKLEAFNSSVYYDEDYADEEDDYEDDFYSDEEIEHEEETLLLDQEVDNDLDEGDNGFYMLSPNEPGL